MLAFARTLVELHHLAQEARAQEFAPEVLKRLGHWIGFDGAVLGLGDACTLPQPRLDITEAHVHARDPGILADYRALSSADPVTAAFVAGLSQPLAVDCRAVYAARRQEALGQFARGHGLRHLLLFGDVPGDGGGRWLVLYRSDDRPFSAQEAERLHAAWLHLSCAIDRHRAALLERHDPASAQARDGPGGGPVSSAAGTALAALTPGEHAAARRFAAGLTHKQVARELGVSPHTVRSQLASAYAKLGLHSKAALVRAFVSPGEGN